jgi:hypothetical protein
MAAGEWLLEIGSGSFGLGTQASLMGGEAGARLAKGNLAGNAAGLEMTAVSNTMTPPFVSVVMSVFNGERFLREAIESILSQTFRDFEFIIINDGSTDGTAAMLDSYARSDPRVRVYQQENKGLIESLNRGCGLARGKYLARMDADDIAVRDRLMWHVEFMERHADIGVVGGAMELIDSAGRAWHCIHYPVENEEIKSALLLYSPFPHNAVVIRKEAFLSVGGYRRLFVDAEDCDLWLRIAQRWRLANLEAVVVKYRIHPDQVSYRKLRQQTLSALAARAFASLRADGSPEPVISDERITPEVLVRLGVNQATQQRALVGIYAFWIGLMSRASQDDAVLRLFEELIDLSRPGPVDRYALSYAMLSAARTHYRRGSPVRALVYVGRALLARPVIAGRPLKRALNSFFRRFKGEEGRA